MASSAAHKLLQFRAKAAEAAKLLTNNGGSYYKNLLEKNKHLIQDPATAETCAELSNQLFYTRLASIPHRYQQLLTEVDGAKQLFKNWRGLTAEHYGLVTLFGIECYAWSWAGKFIGRGFDFTGYKVSK